MAQLKISGEDAEFGAMLNDVYGKGNEWKFVPHADRPEESRLALREAGKLTYLADFGDGFRCSVGILGTLATLKNTAVFIEEIESHQHAASISKLIRHLVKIARTNNLQIFLSTHSKDVSESLARGVYVEEADKEKEEFRCLLLERDIGTEKVTVENTDDL
jgi:predicted ATPase